MVTVKEDKFIVELNRNVDDVTINMRNISIPEGLRSSGTIADYSFSNPCNEDYSEVSIQSSAVPAISTRANGYTFYLNGFDRTRDGATVTSDSLCCPQELNAIYDVCKKLLESIGATVIAKYVERQPEVKVDPPKPIKRLSKDGFLKELEGIY